MRARRHEGTMVWGLEGPAVRGHGGKGASGSAVRRLMRTVVREHGGIRSANVKAHKGIGAQSEGETAVRAHGGTDLRRHEPMVIRGKWVRRHGGTGARRYEGAVVRGSVYAAPVFQKNYDGWVVAFIKPRSPFTRNYRKIPNNPAFEKKLGLSY